MTDETEEFRVYFEYLRQISLKGRIYKRFVSSPILFLCARFFGSRVMEVGSGTGDGVLGAFPSSVVGVDINPFAVEYTRSIGLRASLIAKDGILPIADGVFDSCVLDNVLEHIQNPAAVLKECYRITGPHGGLVIAVPGKRGFKRDSDHRVYYGPGELKQLDDHWSLVRMFSIPLFVKSEIFSKLIRQYCLVAIYKKS